MDVARLMDRWGDYALQNDVEIKLYLDNDKTANYQKKSKTAKYTGISFVYCFVENEVTEDDIFKIKDKQYRVFEIKEYNNIGSVKNHFEIVLFEDDFIHDIEVFDATPEDDGVDAPIKSDTAKSTFKARIKTINEAGWEHFLLQKDRPETHRFTIFYDGTQIDKGDIITWNNENFGILNIENIDEKNKFLVISTVRGLVRVEERDYSDD